MHEEIAVVNQGHSMEVVYQFHNTEVTMLYLA